MLIPALNARARPTILDAFCISRRPPANTTAGQCKQRLSTMAVTNGTSQNDLLTKPGSKTSQPPALERAYSSYYPFSTYTLPTGEHRHYQQQYADMYFARLAKLKSAVEAVASEAFADFAIAGEPAHRVDRVLDVRQGSLCWVVGTVFMEMPLKPNVLDDLGKEHWIAAPPPREKYVAGADGVQIMLEDESGRLRLTGDFLQTVMLVTGVIIAVLGTENANGDFEVLDLRVPDLARQPARWEAEDGEAAVKGSKMGSKREGGGKVALVSGLGFSGDEGDTLALDLLSEWLLGEAASSEDQAEAAQISRLLIVGNSLLHASPIASREDVVAAAKKGGHRKYGYDSSTYNAAPTDRLDQWLAGLLPSIPITLLPGDSDPTSTALPQQPIHAALFPHSRAYMKSQESKEPSWFHSTTNPAELDCSGWRFLSTGGQPVSDVYKYVSGEDRIEMMEAMLRWRLAAPTAPDTLWCYPFQDGDAFVMKECPHVFAVGNQPRFESTVIEGVQGQKVRLLAIPKFRETGELVLLDMNTLEPEIIHIDVLNEE